MGLRGSAGASGWAALGALNARAAEARGTGRLSEVGVAEAGIFGARVGAPILMARALWRGLTLVAVRGSLDRKSVV